ncbi:17288_t:CDS:2, partial [Gigaspora rosea]
MSKQKARSTSKNRDNSMTSEESTETVTASNSQENQESQDPSTELEARMRGQLMETVNQKLAQFEQVKSNYNNQTISGEQLTTSQHPCNSRQGSQRRTTAAERNEETTQANKGK